MSPAPASRPIFLAAACALALLVAGGAYLALRPAGADAASRGVLAELAGSGALARTFAPRLSQPVSYQRCTGRVAAGATIPRASCAGGDEAPPARVFELAARAAGEVGEQASPRALHASALIDLVWSDTVGIPLERSISSLRTAARVSESPGAALADLAAAHLVRAGHAQSVRDLLEAINAAERSLAAEPGNPAALFNRALALHWLGADAQARRGWRDFLAADSTSGWAREAREHLARPVAAPPARTPVPGASPREIQAFAAGSPHDARIHGWNVALGEWARAELRGDVRNAAAWLQLAALLGAVLEQSRGDATLADAVRSIRATAGPRTRTLAEAHAAYAAGRAAFDGDDNDAAGERFARVLALRPPSPALMLWAGRMKAATRAVTGQMGEAERMLDSLVAVTDTVRHPALAGYETWALATIRLRRGDYQAALDAARSAVRHLGRAREAHGVGGALYVQADIEYALGANAAAYSSVHRALATLRPHPGSAWRGSVLAAGARAAAADGLLHAALRLQDERVEVAGLAGRTIELAEAHIARAQLRRLAGDAPGAAADIRAGEALTPRITTDARSWLAADLQLARADAALPHVPAAAAATLDTVIAASQGARPALRRLRALVSRADARLALRDRRGAREDLDRATALLDEQRGALASAPLRASLLDATRAVFDRMVLLAVAEGDTLGALAYLEKGRASLAPSPVRAGAGPLRAPPGRAAISYALVGDTLLAWTVAGGAPRLDRTRVRRDSLLRRIERVQGALEVRAREAAVRADLDSLYAVLLAPVARHLGRGDEVVIVADGELAGVPFAALRDPARGRYLVQDHPTRFAGTLREALRPRVPAPGADGVLLVADPAFDEGSHPALPRLPAARAEVRALAGVYPGAVVLAGAGATPSAVRRALPDAGIVHFAGHAAFDDARPERSHLVLAPDGLGPGTLTAASLAELKLGGVRVVVLSACQTLRAGSGRSGGFAGFAGALVGAGAGGVLGSLWRVDDDLTAALMHTFHRRYRQTGDAPRALRDAQLRMLHSSDPAHRSPAAWAGFRYAGS